MGEKAVGKELGSPVWALHPVHPPRLPLGLQILILWKLNKEFSQAPSGGSNRGWPASIALLEHVLVEEAPSWTLARGLGGHASPHELTPGKRKKTVTMTVLSSGVGESRGLQLGDHRAKLKTRIDLVSGKNTVLRGNFSPVINPLGN